MGVGTDYYTACKCCGHEKLHLGKISSLGAGRAVFISNFKSARAAIAAARKAGKKEEIRGGGKSISIGKFRREVLACASFERVNGEFS